MENHNHSHDHSHENHSIKNRTLLLYTFFITTSFMIIEVVVGLYTGSLTILSDAGHMFSDAVALFLSWFALFISHKPANKTFSFGYHRFQVIATFLNGISFLVISIWIIIEACIRFFNPIILEGTSLLYMGVIGFIVNLIAFYIITRGAKDDMNIQSAILHLASDMLGSLAAAISGIIIMYTGWMKIDPILSLFISILLLRTMYRLIKQSTYILLQATPNQINPDLIKQELVNQIPQLIDVHHIHVWSLITTKKIITLHLRFKDSKQDLIQITHLAKKILSDKFDLSHSTIQVEIDDCKDMIC